MSKSCFKASLNVNYILNLLQLHLGFCPETTEPSNNIVCNLIWLILSNNRQKSLFMPLRKPKHGEIALQVLSPPELSQILALTFRALV